MTVVYTTWLTIRVEGIFGSITSSNEITSKQELQNELCSLFRSADRNGVDLRSTETWVCRHENMGIPDREVMCFELVNSGLSKGSPAD